MVTNTKERILFYIERHGRVRPNELISYLGIGLTAIHRQLKSLIEAGKIVKTGKPPLVFYVMSDVVKHSPLAVAREVLTEIDRTYLYISPAGEVLFGAKGFGIWLDKIEMGDQVGKLANEYVESRHGADSHIGKIGLIDVSIKLTDTFERLWLEKVYYRDFYAIPKFGKTKLGQLVLYSKLAQKKDYIPLIVDECRSGIDKLISKYKIDAVGFIPHSIPRKIQFLKEFASELDLRIPRIQLVKAYSGGMPIAQKSLSRLEERIENARKSIEIKDVDRKYKNVLIIDDAIGSGSTLNEVAKKLKMLKIADKVYGFAIVGSMKGFDVISEV